MTNGILRMFKVDDSSVELRQLSAEARGIIYRWLNNWAKREANDHMPMTLENNTQDDIWRQVGRGQMLTSLQLDLEQHDGHDGWRGCELGPPVAI